MYRQILFLVSCSILAQQFITTARYIDSDEDDSAGKGLVIQNQGKIVIVISNDKQEKSNKGFKNAYDIENNLDELLKKDKKQFSSNSKTPGEDLAQLQLDNNKEIDKQLLQHLELELRNELQSINAADDSTNMDSEQIQQILGLSRILSYARNWIEFQVSLNENIVNDNMKNRKFIRNTIQHGDPVRKVLKEQQPKKSWQEWKLEKMQRQQQQQQQLYDGSN